MKSGRVSFGRWSGDLGHGLRSLAANASYLGLATLLAQVVRAIYMLALARVLGPELYGMLVFGQSWYLTFLPLAVFGVGSVLGRELGKDTSAAGALLDTSLAFRLLTVALSATLCMAIGLVGSPDSLHRGLLFAFSMALIGRGVALWSNHVFVGVERSRLAMQQESTFRPLEALAGLGLVYIGAGIVSLAVLHAVVWWLQAVRGIHLVRRQIFFVFPCWEPWRLFTLARAGAPIALGSALAGWLVTGPLILYARQDSATADLVGQLALSMQVFAVLYGLMLTAGTAAVPILSRAAVRGDGKDLRYLWGMTGGAVLAGGAAALVGTIVGPWIVHKAFGENFSIAGQLLGVALTLLVPLTIGYVASQVLIVRGLTMGLISSAVLGVCGLTVSLPWCVARHGPEGAVIAAGIGAVLFGMAALASAHFAGRAPSRPADVSP